VCSEREGESARERGGEEVGREGGREEGREGGREEGRDGGREIHLADIPSPPLARFYFSVTVLGCCNHFAGALDGTIRDPLLDKFDKWEKEGK